MKSRLKTPCHELSIIHVDMDAFFASCEQQLNPELRGRPIGVVGSPQGNGVHRGVIASASYEARAFGVKNGQPPFKARRLCPALQLTQAHHQVYQKASQQMLKICSRFTDRITPVSVDECFLDTSRTQHLFGGSLKIASKIKQELRSTLGRFVTCSVGVSFNYIFAKVASDLKKPNGLVILSRAKLPYILGHLRPEELCGVGAKTAVLLREMGVKVLADLDSVPTQQLRRVLGTRALDLRSVALGQDAGHFTMLRSRRHPKSISHSLTLPRNLSGSAEIMSVIASLAEKIGSRARRAGLAGRTVSLTLRYQDFQTFSRYAQPPNFTSDDREIACLAFRMLSNIKLSQPVRLVGLSLRRLCPARQRALLDMVASRWRLLEAKDVIEDRYGQGAIHWLRSLSVERKEP